MSSRTSYRLIVVESYTKKASDILEVLSKEVNKHCNAGWVPVGSISNCLESGNDYDMITCCQGMLFDGINTGPTIIKHSFPSDTKLRRSADERIL